MVRFPKGSTGLMQRYGEIEFLLRQPLKSDQDIEDTHTIATSSIKVLTEARYGMLARGAIPWEQEAFYAATIPNMTVKALDACSAGNMWEQYPPTPMTREWLVKNNFIK